LDGLPTGQTRLQTIRCVQPFINADVLQIITEYTAQISSIISPLLLGGHNDCLKRLVFRYIDVRNAAVLSRFSALEQVLFEACTFDVFVTMVFAQTPALKELSLSGCQRLDLSLLPV
jgi:hypothetical protein